jgi:hypothetical protein
MRRHLPARLGAAPACLCANLHMGIILVRFTVFSTQSADLGAQCADPHVPRRAAEHEIGTRLTDVAAIEQQPNMAGFSKDRRFNACLQWRMLGRTGWAVKFGDLKGVRRGPARAGALSRGGPGGWRGLKGESWRWYPAPRRERACATPGRCSHRQEQEGKRLPAHPLDHRTKNRLKRPGQSR